ncbi:MAG: serine hydrolase domain-containing protein [Pseudomonadota bacterium]
MNERMASVEALGLDAEAVASLLARVRREVDEGLLPGAQVALARNGQIAVAESFGNASNESLICMFSATKGITSAAAWLLFQEGTLDEQERVADIIPEFAANDKQDITVQQLFTHTAGFPHAPFRPSQWLSKEETLARFTQWRLTFEPGTQFEYHPSSSMWVIAELIERRSGLSYTDFVRERVLEPLALDDVFVGLPHGQNDRCLPVAHCGEAMTEADYQAMGMPVPPETEVTEDALLAFNQPEVRAIGVPGGGGFANATGLALFYQALLHGGLDGVELWSDETRSDALRVRSGDLKDLMFRQPANRALGLIISGDDSRSFRGFGKTNSPSAFGHNGAGGQLCWADPQTGLSLTYLTPGHDRNNVRQARRGVAISSLAANCVAG